MVSVIAFVLFMHSVSALTLSGNNRDKECLSLPYDNLDLFMQRSMNSVHPVHRFRRSRNPSARVGRFRTDSKTSILNGNLILKSDAPDEGQRTLSACVSVQLPVHEGIDIGIMLQGSFSFTGQSLDTEKSYWAKGNSKSFEGSFFVQAVFIKICNVGIKGALKFEAANYPSWSAIFHAVGAAVSRKALKTNRAEAAALPLYNYPSNGGIYKATVVGTSTVNNMPGVIESQRFYDIQVVVPYTDGELSYTLRKKNFNHWLNLYDSLVETPAFNIKTPSNLLKKNIDGASEYEVFAPCAKWCNKERVENRKRGFTLLLQDLMSNPEVPKSQVFQNFLEIPRRLLQHKATLASAADQKEECDGCAISLKATVTVAFGAGSAAPSCTKGPEFTAEAGYSWEGKSEYKGPTTITGSHALSVAVSPVKGLSLTASINPGKVSISVGVAIPQEVVSYLFLAVKTKSSAEVADSLAQFVTACKQAAKKGSVTTESKSFPVVVFGAAFNAFRGMKNKDSPNAKEVMLDILKAGVSSLGSAGADGVKMGLEALAKWLVSSLTGVAVSEKLNLKLTFSRAYNPKPAPVYSVEDKPFKLWVDGISPNTPSEIEVRRLYNVHVKLPENAPKAEYTVYKNFPEWLNLYETLLLEDGHDLKAVGDVVFPIEATKNIKAANPSYPVFQLCQKTCNRERMFLREVAFKKLLEYLMTKPSVVKSQVFQDFFEIPRRWSIASTGADTKFTNTLTGSMEACSSLSVSMPPGLSAVADMSFKVGDCVKMDLFGAPFLKVWEAANAEPSNYTEPKANPEDNPGADIPDSENIPDQVDKVEGDDLKTQAV